MKNRLWITVLAGLMTTALPFTHALANEENEESEETMKVDVQGDFVSFNDLTTVLKGETTVNEETSIHYFTVQEKMFELNPSTGYAVVDGVDEPYLLRESETDSTVQNVVRLSPILLEGELFVPIQFAERFLDLTYEDGNFKGDDDVIIEGDVEENGPTIDKPTHDGSVDNNESDKVEEETPSKPSESETKPSAPESPKPETKPSAPESPKPETKPSTPESSKPSNPKPSKPNVNVTVTSISVDKKSITMNVGDLVKINASVSPSNVPDTSMTFSSDNTGVVTADGNGNLKAVGVGTATITVISNYTPSVRTTVTVTVNPINVSSVSLNKGNTTLEIGSTMAISAIVAPSNATNKGITWSSSNTRVVTVDGNGNVKAVGAGTATITAKAHNGVSASLTVTVNKKPDPVYTASSVMNSLVNNKGWYKSPDGGVYVGPWEDMSSMSAPIALRNQNGSSGIDANLYIGDIYYDGVWNNATTALSYFTDSSSASKLVSYAKNSQWGTYNFSGRDFKVFMSGDGCIIISIYAKY